MEKWQDGQIDYDALRISSCAPPSCSCPTADLLIEERRMIIKDDFKGECILTFDEFEILYKRFKEYIGK